MRLFSLAEKITLNWGWCRSITPSPISLHQEMIMLASIPNLLLLSGFNGTSRKFKILNYIICVEKLHEDARVDRIRTNNHQDVNIINCRYCNIDNMRDIVNRMKIYPAELQYRWVILEDINFLDTPQSDLLLRIIEDIPIHLRVFATSNNIKKVNNSLLSRFVLEYSRIHTKESIKEVIIKAPGLKAMEDFYNNSVVPINTTVRLRVGYGYDFQKYIKQLFLTTPGYYDLGLTINEFIKRIAKDTELLPHEIMKEFLEWSFDYHILNIFNTEDNKILEYEKIYLSVNEKLSKSLFEYLEENNPARYVNLENQFTTYIISLYAIRKVLGVCLQ